MKIVSDKNADNSPRHIPIDSQANDESASIFDNPSFALDDESQHDENSNNKQVDGQMKPSLRRSYSTDPDDDFSANDINVVGDDLLDARNMRYYKIRVRNCSKSLIIRIVGVNGIFFFNIPESNHQENFVIS